MFGQIIRVDILLTSHSLSLPLRSLEKYHANLKISTRIICQNIEKGALIAISNVCAMFNSLSPGQDHGWPCQHLEGF